MTICRKCGCKLCRDEIGLTYKLINRGSVDFYCFDCLGEMFNVSRDKLNEMAEAFREAGCALFT